MRSKPLKRPAAMAVAQSAPVPAGARQAQALKVIRQHWQRRGESLTRSELGRALGITKVSAHLLVVKLARDGFVVVTPGGWRNVVPAG